MTDGSRPAKRNRSSTARAFLKAERDRRISLCVERMPQATNTRIAAVSNATEWAVEQWRKERRAHQPDTAASGISATGASP